LKDKVISIESIGGPYQDVLKRILRMVPERDKNDIDLQRLLAFRLRLDGEGATSEYLMSKVRDMIQCAYHGRLYDFLKDDEAERTCHPDDDSTDGPPEIA
jgi:hypothetical protein